MTRSVDSQEIEVSLRPFTADDAPACARWAQDVYAERYQSRWFPKGFINGSLPADDMCSWFVIVVNGDDVGTVWLEKERREDDVASLGIMIGREDLFSKGIGREAIRQAIALSRDALRCKVVQLRVRKDNPRAIACYQRCGFSVCGEGVKAPEDGNGIPFFSMRLDVC